MPMPPTQPPSRPSISSSDPLGAGPLGGGVSVVGEEAEDRDSIEEPPDRRSMTGRTLGRGRRWGRVALVGALLGLGGGPAFAASVSGAPIESRSLARAFVGAHPASVAARLTPPRLAAGRGALVALRSQDSADIDASTPDDTDRPPDGGPDRVPGSAPRQIAAQDSDAKPSGATVEPPSAPSVDPDTRPPATIPKERIALHQAAINRGLNYLVRPLERGDSDGSLSKRYSVAVTALGGMALLGAGTEYNRGPYGPYLVQAIEYLLDRRRRDDRGYISDAGGSTPSRMHGHAYAILFLAQVVGCIPLESKDQQVREVVRQGVELIQAAQTVHGGWGYRPVSHDMDEASITVCCLQALRAAKDAGFEVDRRVIEKAVSYLRACAKPDGSFRYSLRGSDKSTFELTAAAVSTLDATGTYTGDVHRRGVEFMDSKVAFHSRNPLDASTQYTYYGNLYAAQVYFQLGGSRWDRWAEVAYPRLLGMQQDDGSWKHDQYGDPYATAMALLMLEIPFGYLPIFER